MNDIHVDDEIVNFPVPKRYLPVVIQALARAMENGASTKSPWSGLRQAATVPWPVPEQTGERIVIVWDLESLKGLRARLNAKAALTMLDLTASRPNERVYFSEVIGGSGRDHSHASADLGSMAKAIKKQFGIKQGSYNWPTQWCWDPERQEACYIMSSTIAEAWNQTR